MEATAQHNLRTKAIKGFFWRFSERIFSQFILFAVSVILARMIGPGEYGVIALTMVFMNIANVLTTGGIGTSLIQKKDADEVDFSTMFYAGLAIATAIYALLFCVAPLVACLYNTPQVCDVLRVLGLTLPISAYNSIQQAIVSSQLEFRKFFYATSVASILSGVVGIGMAWFGYGVWALVGQQMSNILFSTSTLSFIVRWRPKLLFSYKRFQSLFGFGSKLMGANIIGTCFDQLKSFVIGIKYMPADLGLFNRGESIPQLLAINVNNTINTVMFPAISKLQESRNDVKRAIRRSMMTSSYILMPLMFFLGAVADKVVYILLGEKWMGCVPYMRIFCLMYSIGMLSSANRQTFNALGRSDITFKLEFVKKPILLLLVLGAMTIGPLSIAVAYLVYEFFAATINAWPNRKLIDYHFVEQIRDVAPQLLLSAVMSAIVYAIGHCQVNMYLLLVIQACVALTFYLAASKLLALESFAYISSVLKEFSR